MGQGTEKLISKKGVAVKFGLTETPVIPAALTRIGRVKGQVQINDSISTTTVTDMDLLEGDIADIIPNARSVSVSLGTNLIPDDPGFEEVDEAYNAIGYGVLQISGAPRGGAGATLTKNYWGFFSQLNMNFNEDGVAETAIVFSPSQVL